MKSGAIKILDVGCSNGRGGMALKKLDPTLEVAGLDCVPERVASLPNDIYIKRICSSSTKMKLESESVDVVLAGEFIEHLTMKDVDLIIKEFYRIIKPTGQLMVTVSNPSYIGIVLTGGSVLGDWHLSEHHVLHLKDRILKRKFAVDKVLGTGKMSRIIGQNVPILSLYGSYMIIASK